MSNGTIDVVPGQTSAYSYEPPANTTAFDLLSQTMTQALDEIISFGGEVGKFIINSVMNTPDDLESPTVETESPNASSPQQPGYYYSPLADDGVYQKALGKAGDVLGQSLAQALADELTDGAAEEPDFSTQMEIIGSKVGESIFQGVGYLIDNSSVIFGNVSTAIQQGNDYATWADPLSSMLGVGAPPVSYGAGQGSIGADDGGGAVNSGLQGDATDGSGSASSGVQGGATDGGGDGSAGDGGGIGVDGGGSDGVFGGVIEGFFGFGD